MSKQILSLIIIITTLVSCKSTDDQLIGSEVVGQWKLVQMSGNIINSTTTGDDMQWQETYYLNPDGSFLKQREQDGVLKQVEGSYAVVESNNQQSIELAFSVNSEIIGTCDSDLREIMHIDSPGTFYSLWQACDGPGLIYDKVN